MEEFRVLCIKILAHPICALSADQHRPAAVRCDSVTGLVTEIRWSNCLTTSWLDHFVAAAAWLAI